MLNLIITSDCCGSDVVLEDICTACGEHCEVIKEEITAWHIKVYSVECRYTNKGEKLLWENQTKNYYWSLLFVVL